MYVFKQMNLMKIKAEHKHDPDNRGSVLAGLLPLSTAIGCCCHGAGSTDCRASQAARKPAGQTLRWLPSQTAPQMGHLLALRSGLLFHNTARCRVRSSGSISFFRRELALCPGHGWQTYWS